MPATKAYPKYETFKTRYSGRFTKEWDREESEVCISGEVRFDLASDSDSIAETVANSRSIAELSINWDSEQSPGYTLQTWQRATETLTKHARYATWVMGYSLPRPRISPADNGSIDLYWKSMGRDLLLNVPCNPQEPSTFYGENAEGDTISGSFSSNEARPEIVAWLNT